MKKILILSVLTALLVSTAAAQSASILSDTLESKNVTAATASYFCVTALNLVSSDATEESSFNAALENGLLPANVSKDDSITYSNLAYMISKTWKVDKSLMYSLFKNKRYAFKNLKAVGILPQNADPNTSPDGFEFITIISNCIEKYDLLKQEASK